MLYPKTVTSDIVPNNTLIDILASSCGVDTIAENTAWHQIRKGLIEELGGAY